MALHFNNAWYATDDTIETLDILDWGAAKGNSLSVLADQTIGSSTVGWNAYYGGVQVVPDLTTFLKPTNLSSDVFGLSAQAGVGVAGLPTGSKVSFLLGGQAQWRLTPNLTWTTASVRWLRVGSQNGLEVTTNIQYVINPSVAKSLAIQRIIRKAAAAKAAKANAQ
jgi:hypothetical protein